MDIVSLDSALDQMEPDYRESRDCTETSDVTDIGKMLYSSAVKGKFKKICKNDWASKG